MTIRDLTRPCQADTRSRGASQRSRGRVCFLAAKHGSSSSSDQVEGQEFTYGLEEIGHYYKDYARLMEHWDSVLPGKILRVHYEAVVSDLDSQVRGLLDFCGLPFEEACINFHQNDRAVRTASSEQVRQPIFKSGVDQWEHFSAYLDPLRDILGPQLAAT